MSTVSIILPVYNSSQWLPECLSSITHQTYAGNIELSAYDDASTDGSKEIIEKWAENCDLTRFSLKLSGHRGSPHGVGFAKNKCVSQSTGEYLCFLDSDDVMHKDRIEKQLEVAQISPRAIVGCKFHREPPGSTQRFTQWANSLTQDQLYTQVYLSHGPTVIMPTWFCHRDIIKSVGGFDENGKGTPEDLLLFYKHLEAGGQIVRVDLDLLMYRYHPQGMTFSIEDKPEENTKEVTAILFFLKAWPLLLSHTPTQARFIPKQYEEQNVLTKWKSFSIWNAGKQGRKLYRSLSVYCKQKVSMFCDVDSKKIEKKFYIDESSKNKPKPKIPIVHFTQVRPPIILCIKLNLSGNFEQNLNSLRLKEGRDFIHFN